MSNQPVQPVNVVPMHYYLPAQNKRGTMLDITKPKQLNRLFRDLEVLFVRGGVTSEQEKKDHILNYVDLNLEEIWARYLEYKDQNVLYSGFKAAILQHYPVAAGDYLYLLADLNALVGE